jgi:hypothetical protein
MKSLANKFLIVRDSVRLTEHIDPVIHVLDSFFEKANVKAYVTSGLRTPDDQLRIIRSALINNRLADQYQEAFDDITGKTTHNGEQVYNWQEGWSKLLNIGYIVNPPFAAKALMDYFRPGSAINKRGMIIGQSPHTRGTAFDIGGGPDGISQETEVIKSAIGKVKGLKGYLLERNNNAIHVDCLFIDMENYV